MVHGDDFSALGTDAALDKYEKGLSQKFECKFRGRLGEDPKDMKEIRMLNRIIRITPTGLLYEADPRHAELLATSMGLDNCKQVTTPGVKKSFSDDVMDLPVSDNTADTLHSLDARMTRVHVAQVVEEHDVVLYSQIYGCHPSRFVFHKTGKLLKLLKIDD